MKGLKGLILCVLMMAIAYEVAAQFAEVANTSLPGVYDGTVEWGDFDNDGDLDVLLCGTVGISSGVTKVMSNNGDNTFTDINAGLTGLVRGSASWGDYDNDGFLDILLTGHYEYRPSQFEVIQYPLSKIYHNNGNSTFADIDAGLIPVQYGKGIWGDIDNDGDLDIIMTGLHIVSSSQYDYITSIYRNNGNNSFTEIPFNLAGEANADIRTGDFDNDGDLDFIISGGSNFGTRLYINSGNSTFTAMQVLQPGAEGFIALNCDWGDYDHDGDLDLLLAGYSFNGNTRHIKIYRNEGGSVFSDINTNLPCGSTSGSTRWGDYDNDGDLDILHTGCNMYSEYPITKIYRNDSNNVFTDINTNVGPLQGKAAWGDYDNDGDIDIVITGFTVAQWVTTYVTKLFLNYTSTQNLSSSSPNNLNAEIESDFVVLNWAAITDDHTPALSLNYSLRIGTTPGGSDLCSTMSDDSGHRKIVARGYANSNCSWKIQRSALPVSFYWSVQAIDSAFQGSAFAEEQSVSFVPRVSLVSNAYLNFGEVPIGGWSNWKQIIIENTSLAEVNFSSVHLHYDPSQYEINCTHSGLPLLPGARDTLFVRFVPSSLGAQNDTLYIVSDAVNSPLIKIRLAGLSIQVPPLEPDNLEVQMDGNSVVLCWSPVTQTVFNTPIEPDYYFVYQSTDPYGQYFLLGVTPNLTYTHALVGIGAQRMFYKITAYKYYGRGAFDISSLGLEPGMPEEEVWRRLQE